jgi:hypothetical protein
MEKKRVVLIYSRGSNPNPDTWGEPSAEFGGSCDLNSYFRKLYMIFNVTFCGYQFGAGGQSWAMDPVCSALAPTCESKLAIDIQSIGANVFV